MNVKSFNFRLMSIGKENRCSVPLKFDTDEINYNRKDLNLNGFYDSSQY